MIHLMISLLPKSPPQDTTHVHNVPRGIDVILTEVLLFSRPATADLTRDLTVLARNLAVKIIVTSDFHAKRQPQNQSNLLQIRGISEHQITGLNVKKNHMYNYIYLIKEGRIPF